MNARRYAGLVLAVGCLLWFLPKFRLFRPAMDVPAVVLQVRRMNELVTVSYTVQKVAGLKQKREPLGAESILLMVQAKVLAGVDLGKLKEQDVTMKSGTEAVIRLHPAHIIETFLDEKNTKVWDRQITWWTPWVAADPDLEHKARLEALDQVKANAIEMGILKDAQRNAERDIRAILQAFGITQVTFISTPD